MERENRSVWAHRLCRDFLSFGPITSVHLSKNIGLPLAKPDRHLVRLANDFGYESAEELCEQISSLVGDSVAVVDVVLWRYATITSIRGAKGINRKALTSVSLRSLGSRQ